MTEQPEPEWENIACPVCEQESFTPLFEKDNEPFVRCDHCTLVLINPRPVYNHVLKTYDDDYSRSYANKAEKKIKRSLRRIKLIKKDYVPSGRWLDVGCSAGFVVKAASDSGFTAYGVDVEPWGIEYGRKSLNLEKLSQGMLEEQNYPDHFFDVISLYDVIEHVPNLNTLVGELGRILSKDGVIDIVTPDVGHWRTTKPLHNWKEIKPSEHLYYFDKATLDRLMQKHGLAISRTRLSLKSSMKACIQHRF